jgi:hypothetical protein
VPLQLPYIAPNERNEPPQKAEFKRFFDYQKSALLTASNESTTLDEVVLLQDSMNRLVLMEANSDDLTF